MKTAVNRMVHRLESLPPGTNRVGASHHPCRAWLGGLLGILIAIWLRTLRVTLVIHPDLDATRSRLSRPWVLSFFHGTQFPLLAWARRRRIVVMVSHSRDGALQAGVLGRLNFTIVRGSSSQGGARALARLVRTMRDADRDAAFAVDGPKGPRGQVKGGAIVAARATDALLVPMGSACERSWTFTRAWDRYVLPWPFSRVAVVLGAPISCARAPTGETDTVARLLERAIDAANEEAASTLYNPEPRPQKAQRGVEP